MFELPEWPLTILANVSLSGADCSTELVVYLAHSLDNLLLRNTILHVHICSPCRELCQIVGIDKTTVSSHQKFILFVLNNYGSVQLY